MLDDKNLETLIKALKRSKSSIKVGVLGSSKDPVRNASIGAAHEFNENGYERSFLRMPLTEMLSTYLKDIGLEDGKTIKRAFKEKNLNALLHKIGITAVNTVFGAFETGGFGKWRQSDFRRKINHQTLVESTQLRDSITYEVDQ